MLKIENTEVMGWEHAIRGMRNPMNSWEKSDSFWNGKFLPMKHFSCLSAGVTFVANGEPPIGIPRETLRYISYKKKGVIT